MIDNAIVQYNEIVHIAIKNPQVLSQSDQEMAITVLHQRLESYYDDVEMLITRNKYDILTDISIKFSNIEDATHFKLSSPNIGPQQ